MTSPAIPANEAQRLAALREYRVLDTVPDPAFDDLTALAAQMCDVPIAVISLVDENRQWIKSKLGLSVDEVPREVSFCGHTILEPDLLVVPDAHRDERFAANPLVVGPPGIRFYAGAPLVDEDGQALGALCVIDRVPRELNGPQREASRALARQVMAQLNLRRHARELLDSESRLLQVFQNCPVALSINRWSDRAFVEVNPAFTSLLGWTQDEVAGRTSQDLHLVEAAVGADLRSQLNTNGVFRDAEVVATTRGGARRDLLVGAALVMVRNEPHAITTFVDITQRKQAEAAWRRLAAIVESSDDAIIGSDLDGIVTSWNRAAAALFGYADDEIVGTSLLRLIPLDRQEEGSRILGQIQRGEHVQHFETLRLTKSGALVEVSVSASPIVDAAGTIVGLSKVSRDIAARKRIEEARRVTEARYRTLFESAPDGIVIADPRSYYLDANASMCEMLGYTHDELVGLHASDIVVAAELPQIELALTAIHATADYHREWQFRRKDGTTFPAEVIATTMPDGNLLGMIRDITERKRIEARFRRLVDSNAQGVMFWNVKGEVSGANDTFLRIVGYSREEMDDRRIDWITLTPPDYAELDRRALKELAATGVCSPYEKEYVRKDGSRVPVLVGAAGFEDNPDEGVCFVLDLTERKKLEKQFLRAQRMESIGTLAGGIAHDLNNELTPILLAAEMLVPMVSSEDGLRCLQTLAGSARRGAELVKQVLSFARGVEGERVSINLVHLMNDLRNIMRDTFPKSINVRFASPRDLWTVTGDATQLHQVFVNLCVNARDAMPDGGDLTVTLANVVLDDTYVAMNIDARPGAYVIVTVADTGMGIPDDIRDRIFEPFFTTKEIGKGTGLGLSTTLGIVKSHGGFIHVYSEERTGTKLKVYLPADAAESAVLEVAVEQTGLPRGRGELVLVVDDEEPIRQIVQACLERFGYRVLVACHGAEAVAVYARNQAVIAVVLTDMAMPIMDGHALVVALKTMNPDVRIIGSSGLASNAAVAKAMGAGAHHFIPKPYTAEAILKTIHQLLRGADGNSAP